MNKKKRVRTTLLPPISLSSQPSALAWNEPFPMMYLRQNKDSKLLEQMQINGSKTVRNVKQ